jgi:hypothetical protein
MRPLQKADPVRSHRGGLPLLTVQVWRPVRASATSCCETNTKNCWAGKREVSKARLGDLVVGVVIELGGFRAFVVGDMNRQTQRER